MEINPHKAYSREEFEAFGLHSAQTLSPFGLNFSRQGKVLGQTILDAERRFSEHLALKRRGVVGRRET